MFSLLRSVHVTALVLSLTLVSGCSSLSPLGRDSSDISHTPKYPSHTAVPPSMPPSAFSEGTPYDWETSTQLPPRSAAYRFANTRTFEETGNWIKKTMEAQTAAASSTDPSTRFSDIHFEGCNFLWYEEQGVGSTHINTYGRAVNLARANLGQMLAFSSSFRVGWEEDRNTLFRAWEKERDGDRWTDLGEQLQSSTSKDFPASNSQMADRLRYAFVHAARLCGARVPEH
jgi:hypothetical protein